MSIGGSLSLKQLHDRGFTDDKIAEMGGVIQGRNVVFKDKIGGFDSTGAVLRVAPRPRPASIDVAAWLKENGPKLWKKFHDTLKTIALDRDAVEAFVQTQIIAPLPCSSKCKPHARKLLKDNPPDVSSRRELLDWGYDYHDGVNVNAGHPVLGRDAARAIHEP